MNSEALSAFRIIPATPEMLPDILALEEACFSAPWTRKMLEAELTSNQFAHFLVARHHQESATKVEPTIIGYHCFWIVFEELRLMNLAVRESMRKRGVGRALVSEALRRGLGQATTRAVLEVRASNEPARALYTRLGFVQISSRPHYYTNPTEDAVLMEMNPLVILRDPQRDKSVASGGEPASTNPLERGGVVMLTEDAIVEQLRHSNTEFRELEASHHRLDLELNELQKRHVLTPTEEIEKKRMQKEKLAKKDKLAELIRLYREQRLEPAR